MTAADLTILLFALSNALRVLAFVPQIVRIVRDEGGAAAVSYTAWILFGLSNLTTAVYAVLIVEDWLMALLFMASTAACGVILGLTFIKRAQISKQALQAAA